MIIFISTKRKLPRAEARSGNPGKPDQGACFGGASVGGKPSVRLLAVKLMRSSQEV